MKENCDCKDGLRGGNIISWLFGIIVKTFPTWASAIYFLRRLIFPFFGTFFLTSFVGLGCGLFSGVSTGFAGVIWKDNE